MYIKIRLSGWIFGLLLCTAQVYAQEPTDTAARQLPEVLIRGNFPAYLQALEQQRQAEGVVSVLNLDLPGRFPDLNPAEALQRLPGIALQRSQGEGRFVHIRGADPALTTVRVNGEQIVSPEASNRFLQFDLLPVDQLRAVEVWKTNSPDQDGDAIGGSVNLCTNQATGGKTGWQAALSGGFNPAAGLPNGQARLAYTGKRLALNGSFWQDHRATDNLETVYGIPDAGAAGNSLFISDLDLRHFEVARRRAALGGACTLPFGGGKGQGYLQGIIAGFEEKNLRQRLRYRPGKGVGAGVQDTVFGARIGRDVQYARETEHFVALQAGARFATPTRAFDGMLAYSAGLESEPEGLQLDFKLPDVDMTGPGSDARFPQYSLLNGKSPERYDDYVLNELEKEDERSTDRALSVQANARVQINGRGDYLKFGAKGRFREKNTRARESIYDEYDGPAPILLSELLEPGSGHSFLGERYFFGRYLDWDKSRAVIDANAAAFRLNATETAIGSAAGNFNIREGTAAAYALAHAERGRWAALAGARLEYTHFRYVADAVSIAAAGVSQIPGGRSFSGNYAFLLPAVQARYKSEKGWQGQAVLSASYARPTFDQLAPFELFNQLDGEVVAGNPALKPVFSWNLDLGMEKTLRSGGAISAGLFGKNIRRFIFTRQSRETRLWNGNPVDVLRTGPVNGDAAWLAGVELAWQQRFVFLPGAWAGLGIFSNYSYTWSQASVEEETGAATGKPEEHFRLPGQAAHTANLALWYDHGRWSGRVALNLQSDFLLLAGEPEETESQLIYGGSTQLDATAGFAISRRIVLFAEGMNLLNTPLQYFTGDHSHPSKLEYYGAWGRIGVQMRW